MADATYSQALTMIFDKFPNIPKDFSEMEKLLQYSAPGRKLPRLKLRRKVKSPIRSSTRVREQAEGTDESETEAPSNNKILEKDYTKEEEVSVIELKKVERAKEKADAKASRLQVTAQLAYAEVERLSKEIKELKASRLQVAAGIAHAEVEQLSEEIKVLKKMQAENLTTPSPKPSPSPGGKRWNSEVMNVRLNNKKLNPEDYVMDVEDKGDEIDIKLRIK